MLWQSRCQNSSYLPFQQLQLETPPTGGCYSYLVYLIIKEAPPRILYGASEPGTRIYAE